MSSSRCDPGVEGQGIPVLLVGEAAQNLAPRLELSGYCPLACDSPTSNADAEPGGAPAAVLLGPGDGAQVAALRRCWGAVPILLGLPNDSLAERSRCLASGADDFWLTDRPPSDLLTRLRLHLTLVARATASEQGLLRLGDLVLDPLRRHVRRGPRTLALTEREYQLLLLLLRHRGEVVSREHILRAIWNDAGGGPGSSNVIEVYVRYLRQKLEQNGGRRLIHTVRGQGYSLAERWPPAGER
ncbi:MAG: response regulator transcription factor [Synechococcaceae cyanobacterium]|nr:response regulator transcription factor [Synechococcaceae cyanobacterium]